MELITRVNWMESLRTMKIGEIVEIEEFSQPELSIRSAVFRLKTEGVNILCSHKFGEPIRLQRLPDSINANKK